MKLFVPRDDRIYDRDPDAASNVADQIVEAAGVADFFVLQKCHGCGSERHKDASGAEAVKQDRPNKTPPRARRKGRRFVCLCQ